MQSLYLPHREKKKLKEREKAASNYGFVDGQGWGWLEPVPGSSKKRRLPFFFFLHAIEFTSSRVQNVKIVACSEIFNYNCI